MEESAVTVEDSETNYNMGVAFKEMNLYDEAIGEFQKVHEMAVQSKDDSNVVQCCSLLATCFLCKNLPLLAVRWCQTALDANGVAARIRWPFCLKWDWLSSWRETVSRG